MQSLQRAAVLFTGIALVLVLPFRLEHKRMELRQEAWKQAVLEEFCAELCRTGQCRTEEYQRCQEILLAGFADYELCISEYRREEGNGVYWYFTSWEEIRSCLSANEVYLFEEGSVLEITAISEGKKAEPVLFCSGRIGAENK